MSRGLTRIEMVERRIACQGDSISRARPLQEHGAQGRLGVSGFTPRQFGNTGCPSLEVSAASCLLMVPPEMEPFHTGSRVRLRVACARCVGWWSGGGGWWSVVRLGVGDAVGPGRP